MLGVLLGLRTALQHRDLRSVALWLRMRSWYHRDATDLLSVCERLGIPVFETDFTNSEETVRLFKEATPDLGLSLGNSYISPSVFSIPKYGMINCRVSRTNA